MALLLHPALGWWYGIPVLLATLDLVMRNVRLWQSPKRKTAFGLFKASNVYLGMVLLFICIDVLL